MQTAVAQQFQQQSRVCSCSFRKSYPFWKVKVNCTNRPCAALLCLLVLQCCTCPACVAVLLVLLVPRCCINSGGWQQLGKQ